ncbi:MAG: TolC family protein [Deltaproteobacteria bacterium]|jgi:outer membrane protein TolC|nr:TolC family protein [Deltaproteobacteria bacterium]MDL1986635.1 TolC family protein [Deltaproteobacteria bacterium]
MNKFVVLIISACLTIPFSFAPIVRAAEGGETFLTLNKAIETALHNNTLIKQAIENQKAAIEEQKSARADFLPKASAGYSYTKLKDAPYAILGGTQIDVGDNDQYHWDLTLSQPLFTGFALSTRYEMAKLGVDVKDAEKEQAILDVVKQVKAAYFNILLTKKFLLVADEAVNQLESHVRDAEKFYEQGMIPYNDLLRSKVALADAKQTGVKAASNVERTVSAFNTLLRLDLNRKTDVEDILDIAPCAYDLSSLIKESMENRPELKALRLALKNADHGVTLAQSAYYPEVNLVGSYEQNGHNPPATENDYGNTHNASVTLQARWTFFEWGKTRAEVNKYRRNKSSLAEKLKGIEDSIKLEVKGAFLDLKVAKKNIQTAKKSLVQAEENWRITNLQYQQQMTTSTEVLDARTFLTRAETNYYSALYGYMISLAELERAVGRMIN